MRLSLHLPVTITFSWILQIVTKKIGRKSHSVSLISFIKRWVCKKSCLAQLLFIERYKKWIAKIQLSYRVHGIMRTVFNVEIITHKFLFVNFCFNFIIINNLQMKQNMFLIFLLLRLDYDFFKELFLGRAGEMFQFDCNI